MTAFAASFAVFCALAWLVCMEAFIDLRWRRPLLASGLWAISAVLLAMSFIAASAAIGG